METAYRQGTRLQRWSHSSGISPTLCTILLQDGIQLTPLVPPCRRGEFLAADSGQTWFWKLEQMLMSREDPFPGRRPASFSRFHNSQKLHIWIEFDFTCWSCGFHVCHEQTENSSVLVFNYSERRSTTTSTNTCGFLLISRQTVRWGLLFWLGLDSALAGNAVHPISLSIPTQTRPESVGGKCWWGTPAQISVFHLFGAEWRTELGESWSMGSVVAEVSGSPEIPVVLWRDGSQHLPIRRYQLMFRRSPERNWHQFRSQQLDNN